MIAATDPAPVDLPDDGVAEAARGRLAAGGPVPGPLGELADVVAWLAAVHGACPPPPLTRVRCVVFAADHGIAPDGGADVAARQLLAGEGPYPLLAAAGGAELRLVDVGLAGAPLPGAASRDRVRAGSAPLDHADALTPDEVLAAVTLGRRIVDEEVDAGADLLVPAALGTGTAVPAAALVAALTRNEPVWALGFDAGVGDAEWSRRCAAVRDGLHRVGQGTTPMDPHHLLQTVGGADLAALTGFLLQAAVRRTPVLLDGPAVAAAALVARELAWEAPAWWRAPHRSGVAAERLALDELRLEPVAPLNLRLGDGCGALAVLPLLRAAVDLFAAMPAPPVTDTPSPPPADAVPPDAEPAPPSDAEPAPASDAEASAAAD